MIYVLSGGEKIRSIIYVTYPAGSICTCKNGTKTLKAKDTSGYALFNVKPGTYTVECHTSDNSQSASKSVSVTAEGRSEIVTLSFLYYLYNTGDECTAITGGWKARKQGSGGTFTKKETSLYVQGVSGNGMNAATANTIDLTPFSTAKIRLVKVSSSGIGKVFFTTNSVYSETGNSTLNLSATSEPKVVSLDIKSLNGSYYAVFNSINSREIEFDQMWLEE